MGRRGPEVAELQRRLSEAGFPLAVDGIFGPRTRAALRLFQLERGLAPDGVAGPATEDAFKAAAGSCPLDQHVPDSSRYLRETGSLRAPTIDGLKQRPANTVRAKELSDASRPSPSAPVTARPAPSNGSQEAQYRHYEQLVRDSGGRMRPGERTVLALRGLGVDGRSSQTTAGKKMNDSFVVLWRDPSGRAHVESFAGSTHPGQRRSTRSPDVNGDGEGDVGLLSEGSYRVTANGQHNGAASFVVKTESGSGRLPAVRDLNHDGRYSDAEQARSRRQDDRLSQVLFHPGSADGGVRSIGCMNVQDWDGFVQAIGGGGASFNFTLVRAAGG